MTRSYETDLGSGLQYAGARFYDPDLGLFLTNDPARQFASPYTYTNWDPVNRTDPNGAAVEWGVIAAIAVFAFAVGFASAAIQAGVNGASLGQALKAGAISGGISGVSAAGLGLIGYGISALAGEAAPTVLPVFTAVVAAGGLYGAAESARSGQWAAFSISVLMIAYGLYGITTDNGEAAVGQPDPEDPLEFSQSGLERVDKNGNVLENFGGVSGNGDLRSDTPGLDFSKATGVPNEGPIPAGSYTVDPRNIEYFSNLSPDDRFASWMSAFTRDRNAPWHFGPPAWGDARVAIKPALGTNTLGRGGFFIHGGWFSGSSGCIDLANNAGAFFNWLQAQSGPVPLAVHY